MKVTVLIIGVLFVATEFLVSSIPVYEDNNKYLPLNSNEAINYDSSYQTNNYDEGKYYSTKRSDHSSKFQINHIVSICKKIRCLNYKYMIIYCPIDVVKLLQCILY